MLLRSTTEHENGQMIPWEGRRPSGLGRVVGLGNPPCRSATAVAARQPSREGIFVGVFHAAQSGARFAVR
jgi:hypothetical protein